MLIWILNLTQIWILIRVWVLIQVWGTSFAKITPDLSKKVSVAIIQGISNYFTFMWPTSDEEGFIVAYEIRGWNHPKNP